MNADWTDDRGYGLTCHSERSEGEHAARRSEESQGGVASLSSDEAAEVAKLGQTMAFEDGGITTEDQPDGGLIAELLRRQDALQVEAADILADLDLFAVLSRAGEVTQVGSSAFGLMVRRDIDLCVVCDAWNADVVLATVRPLASHPRVRTLSYRNETGAFNPRPAIWTDGHYCGVGYRAESGEEWTLDIWFWSRGAPAKDIEHTVELRRRLEPETRAAILWIKDAHHRLRPFAEYEVASVDIYDAVLDHGVRTPSEFGAYLAERQRPVGNA